ncbi:hypothetical protein MMC21_007286 [Puttea exsequens]|nr:hypothetical protein [Puttea exsequens]
MADEKTEEKAKQSVIVYAKVWGESPVPPTFLAAMITAQALRPPQFLPMLFPPVLLFSTYLNLADYPVQAAGTSAAWSGLYMLLASRRKQSFTRRFGARGIIRGATMGMCAAQVVAGGLVYAVGRKEDEDENGS